MFCPYTGEYGSAKNRTLAALRAFNAASFTQTI